MALYFFNADNGGHFVDSDGIEFADDDAARDAAIQGMADLAREQAPRNGERQKNITMWVLNEKGETVLQLALSFAARRGPTSN